MDEARDSEHVNAATRGIRRSRGRGTDTPLTECLNDCGNNQVTECGGIRHYKGTRRRAKEVEHMFTEL